MCVAAQDIYTRAPHRTFWSFLHTALRNLAEHGEFCFVFVRSLALGITEKKLLKSVHICQRYYKKLTSMADNVQLM